MAGYSTKNKTFRSGGLKDANISVIGDGYGANARYAGVDGYGNLCVKTQEGQPEHFNGTVGTSPITITPSSKTSGILIENPNANDCTDILQVSFDGGTNYFDIERRRPFSIETEVTSFKLKSNAAGTEYQIIVTRIVE